MQGSKSLKVMGILGIVFGLIGLIINLFSLVQTVPYLGYASLVGINPGLFVIAAIISILAGIMLLITGVMGVINWSKPDKASVCVFFGIATIAVTVLANILAILAYPAGINAFSIFSGLLIPVIYVVVAYQYKKAFSQTTNNQFFNNNNQFFNQ